MTQTDAGSSVSGVPPVGDGSFSLETVRTLEHYGADRPSLGSIVSWGMKSIVIAQDELRQLLDQNHLHAVKIPAIRSRKALNRALKEMVQDELIRLVADNAERITYVLIKVSNDQEQEEVVFKRTLKVSYRKNAAAGSDPLTFSSVTAESVLRPLIEKYQTSYVSNDISRFILLTTVKACNGILLRPEGGVYFVPTAEQETMLHLRDFLDDLAAQQNALAYLSMFTIIDDTNAKRDMQRHAHEALKGELRTLHQELEKLTRKPDRSVRAVTVAKYLQEADRVGQEAALYRDLILLEAEDITQALDTLRQLFCATLQGDGNDPFADRNATSPAREANVLQGTPDTDPGF